MGSSVMYERIDYFNQYGPVMQFEKNKDENIHRWYPFVEGYSKEFIRSIINELDYTPLSCLDPFAGSGTTPLELQKLGIKCYSFEVCPFMHDLSVSKMRTDYTLKGLNNNLNTLLEKIEDSPDNIDSILSLPEGKWIVEREGIDRWNFNREVLKGIFDLKHAISMIKDTKYRDLFKIALASILLKVSNLYRNGKCLSYKPKWKEKVNYTRNDVHSLFFDRLNNIFIPDIKKLEKYKKQGNLFSNSKYCYFGDARKNIINLDDESIDLVITSPPYLNSRDYTDSYIVELKMLDYLNNYSSMPEYRSRTLRSHVQVKWPETEPLNIYLLRNAIKKITKQKQEFWNESILDMISGYFQDMDLLFTHFSRILTHNGHIFFNVANSAYFGVEIKVAEIIAEIATSKGLQVEEIRNARYINPSSQQKKSVSKLIESVLVISKP
ncbi:MAG: hypothetical protein ACM3KR_05165 [Deltaproteobacteria bacterium]